MISRYGHAGAAMAGWEPARRGWREGPGEGLGMLNQHYPRAPRLVNRPALFVPSTIPGSPMTVEVSACRGNNSDLVPSSITDPKTRRMQGKVAR